MKAIMTVLMLLLIASPCFAVEATSVENGKQLFESTELGSNGKSCSSCHPQGKGLEKIATYDDAKLKTIVNTCIRNALKGKALDPESTELASLLSYLRSLQPGS